MSLLRRLWDRYQSAKLEAEVKFGRKPWGRQAVVMPARATISAKVIRADGTVEDLGVLAQAEVDAAVLDELRRQAGN